jgi:hypothetical protein
MTLQFFDQLEHPMHGRAGADQVPKAVFGFKLLP